ncbi:hypothetical protein QTG54_011177 [Skeletonema marinoi]|uniref:Uncharacterized protein n=1 Tax=Skeletonema marinoi TaxID=267567 RepID=A0AAD8Y2C1_9STRA|nr:hypothetical protein QTG54_011177 [Skeletonema marinoi]
MHQLNARLEANMKLCSVCYGPSKEERTDLISFYVNVGRYTGAVRNARRRHGHCIHLTIETHSSVTRNAKRIVGLRPKRSARSIHEEVVKSGQLSCKEGGNMSVCVRIAIQVEMIMHVMLGIKKNKQTKNYFTLLTNCTSMTLPPTSPTNKSVEDRNAMSEM